MLEKKIYWIWKI